MTQPTVKLLCAALALSLWACSPQEQPSSDSTTPLAETASPNSAQPSAEHTLESVNQYCAFCHNEQVPSADLRLDLVDFVRKPGSESGGGSGRDRRLRRALGVAVDDDPVVLRAPRRDRDGQAGALEVGDDRRALGLSPRLGRVALIPPPGVPEIGVGRVDDDRFSALLAERDGQRFS